MIKESGNVEGKGKWTKNWTFSLRTSKEFDLDHKSN